MEKLGAVTIALTSSSVSTTATVVIPLGRGKKGKHVSNVMEYDTQRQMDAVMTDQNSFKNSFHP
jgi:hypothetical protein